jgi:3-methyladenine DNA glycosylase AlkD
MEHIEQLIQRVARTHHGFTDIRKAADEVMAANTSASSLAVAHTLLTSDVHQARMLATFLFGHLATAFEESLTTLRTVVSRDADWRVQEILAQAFDMYCATIGYDTALPVIEEWLHDAHANVRRAATEGLRIWTSRPYFRTHPDHAVQLLSRLHNDNSEYVRKSVGNALRDISRKHPEVVRQALKPWDCSDKRAAYTHKLASKFISDT